MAKRHFLQSLLAPLLLPVSPIYGWMASKKRERARSGKSEVWFPPRPCISVGNISWGGTGKTPVTDYLLSHARVHGKKAAVLTRGYGSNPPNLPFLVEPDSNPSDCGDEPLMLKKRHPEAIVAVDPERTRAGKALCEKEIPDLFILDDGFQHVRIGRHTNLVLLDEDDVRLTRKANGNPSNWNRTIPAGTWREPEDALQDATAFLIKVKPEEWDEVLRDAKVRLQKYPRPIFAFAIVPDRLRLVSGNGEPDICPKEYVFVSGIADPQKALATTVEFTGMEPSKTLFFKDHFDFAKAQHMFEGISMPIICTAKDADKLAKLNLGVPCYALDVHAHFFASASVEGKGFTQDFSQWLFRQIIAASC